MQPCSLDLRERIVKAYANGEGSVRDLAERFTVAPKTVQSYLTLLRETGSVAPRPRTNGPRPMVDGKTLDDLRSLVEQTSDATLDELADQLASGDHVVVSRFTVRRALQRLGITRKKNASCDRARHGRSKGASPELRGPDR
jgi:transposase